MRRVLITAPSEPVVTTEEARAQLRLSDTPENNALVEALVSATVAQIDPAFGGWLGRALRPQVWELRGVGFPYCDGRILLPYRPTISIDSITHADRDGVDVTLAEGTDYRVFLSGANSASYVMPIYNQTWPASVLCDEDSVRLRFTAGYSSTPADTLPQNIKQAVILGVRELYSLGERSLYLRSQDIPGLGSFEWTVTENAGKVVRAAIENLLAVNRVYE